MLELLDFKFIIAIVGAVFLFIGYVPYFKDVFKGKTKPHLYTWLIWAITQGTATVALIYGGGNFGAISLFIGTILVLAIFVLSFKYGTKDIAMSDKIFLGLASVAVIIWWQLDSPLIAVLLITLIDAIGFIPTIRKSFFNPWSETIFFWLIMAIVDILALISNAEYNPLTVTYLSMLTIGNMIVVFVCLYRRRVIKKIV